MQVARIHIENFRGIKDTTLDFASALNIAAFNLGITLGSGFVAQGRMAMTPWAGVAWHWHCWRNYRCFGLYVEAHGPCQRKRLLYRKADMPPTELIVRLQAHEDHVWDPCEVQLELREASFRAPGRLSYCVAQGQPPANRFFLMERWADAAALAQHEQTQHFLQGVARVQTCCESIDIQQVSWFSG